MTVGRREALKALGMGAMAATLGTGVSGSARAHAAAGPTRAEAVGWVATGAVNDVRAG